VVTNKRKSKVKREGAAEEGGEGPVEETTRTAE
jgi:hypothetical protein